MEKIRKIIENDKRPNLEKRAFDEVVKAFSDEEKAHAMLILLEWAESLE